jgi:tetratricopeptide (TPR) repeat protein
MSSGQENTDMRLRGQGEGSSNAGLPAWYRQACRLAEQGRYDDARQIYSSLIAGATEPGLKALVANDLAVLAVMEGRIDEALQGWERAIEVDAERPEDWHRLAGDELSNATTCCCALSHPQWSN